MTEFVLDIAFGAYPELQNRSPREVIEEIDKGFKGIFNFSGWGQRSLSASSFNLKIQTPDHAIDDKTAIISPGLELMLITRKGKTDDNRRYHYALVPNFGIGGILAVEQKSIEIERDLVPESLFQKLTTDCEIARLQREISRLQKNIDDLKGQEDKSHHATDTFTVSKVATYRKKTIISNFELIMPDLEVTGIYRDSTQRVILEMNSSWQLWEPMRDRIIEKYKIQMN